MKKILLLLSFIFLFLPMTTLAVTPRAPDPVNVILPPPGGKTADGREVSVPRGNFLTDIVPAGINIILGLAGAVAFIVFSYTGIMLLVSQGTEEEITKAKNIFLYSAIGLAVIAASYGLIYGILKVFVR